MTDQTRNGERVLKLRPCPFCGGASSHTGTIQYSAGYVEEQGWSQDTFYFCNCTRCGVSNQGMIGYQTQADAITAWNTRHGEALAAQGGGEDD